MGQESKEFRISYTLAPGAIDSKPWGHEFPNIGKGFH